MALVMTLVVAESSRPRNCGWTRNPSRSWPGLCVSCPDRSLGIGPRVDAAPSAITDQPMPQATVFVPRATEPAMIAAAIASRPSSRQQLSHILDWLPLRGRDKNL